jgi:hypothetical protein
MDVRETLQETADDMEVNIEDIQVLESPVLDDEGDDDGDHVESSTISDNENTAIVEEERRESAPQVSAVPAPSGWRSDEKEIFAKLPPEVQETVSRRERERDAYLHQSRQKWSEVEKAVEPYENELNRNGVSVGKMVSQALAWDKYLKEKPVDAILELANACKVDLRQFAQVAQAAQPQDPYVNHLYQEQAQLKAKLEALENEKLQARQYVEQQHNQSVVQEVEAFIGATDATGRAIYPYANDLREDMATLLPLVEREMPNASTRQKLEELYGRAMRANPRAYAELQRQQTLQMQEANRQKVGKAKNAGSSLSGAPNGSKTVSDLSIRGLLKAGLANEI